MLIYDIFLYDFCINCLTSTMEYKNDKAYVLEFEL